MNIKLKLQDLYILQDSITHLNAKGKEESEEARAMLEERKIIIREIVEYVEYLEEGLQLSANRLFL